MNILLHSEEDQQVLKEKQVPFWHLVNMLDHGISEAQITKQHPLISTAEIKAAIKYAVSTAVVAE